MEAKQPEALVLAAALDDRTFMPSMEELHASAAELRRLHSLNAELLAALQLLLMHGTDTNYIKAGAAVEAARAAIARATQA